MSTLQIVLGAVVVVGWVIGSLVGWAGDGPWNWRVLIGPKTYYRWVADRRVES